MKKIPTLFERVYEDHKAVAITDKVTEGCEAVLEGKTVLTIKMDGSCCAIINGELYKRYDKKRGKKAPEGAIPCCDADPVTGHHPHWVKVDRDKPADKWFVKAWESSPWVHEQDGTYEAIGLHFQGNPYKLNSDGLYKHGGDVIKMAGKPTFEKIRRYLKDAKIEGIVFWQDGEPLCKIKRSDFGFEWPIKVTE